DRIAAEIGPALDRFQQEAVGAAVRQLEHRRDRRLQVGDQCGRHDLRRPRLIDGRERVEGRKRLHRSRSSTTCLLIRAPYLALRPAISWSTRSASTAWPCCRRNCSSTAAWAWASAGCTCCNRAAMAPVSVCTTATPPGCS